MVLKALELYGFKSFPDKTRLEFDSGMTAVVGPNGSGKSNIGDAILWVLGEQSTKNLRGDKMEDIIFSGTNDRSQVNIAKVSLFLDNTDGELPVDEKEVIIERKLYRSGESNYKINGTSVRLKDIYELFMDTGIGKHGYSMVGQGKISEIVSAKSSDRREIFEEAAGISKFKYRKKEAEKRLSQTEENLNRALDIKLELFDRLEPLKKESDKAEEFLKLSEEKKGLEVSIFVDDLNKLNVTIKEYAKEIDVLDLEINKLDEDVKKGEEQLEDTFCDLQKISLETTKCNDNILNYNNELSKIDSDIAVLHNDILHNKKDIDRINIDINNLNSDKESFNENVKIEERNIKILNEEISLKDIKIKEVTNEFIGFNEEFSKTEETKQTMQEDINSYTLKALNLTASINRNKEKVDDNKETLKRFKDNNDNYLKKLNEINLELKETKENISMLSEDLEKDRNIQSGYNIKYERLLSEYKEIEKRAIKYKDVVFELVQKIKTSKNLRENMDGFYFSVKSILKESKNGFLKGVNGTVSQLITADHSISLSIETALSSALQNIVTDDDISAKSCIKYLKDKKLGRATFLPLTNVKSTFSIDENVLREENVVGVASELVKCDEKYKNIIRNLLGRVLIVDNIETASFIGKKYNYKFKIVTIDGQVINSGGSFTGGSSIKSTGIFNRDTEIEELSKQLDKEKNTLNEINSKYETVKNDLLNLQNTIKKIKDREITIELDIKSLKNKELILQNNIVSFSSENEEVVKTITRLENENTNYLDKIKENEILLINSEEKLLQLKNDLISFDFSNKEKIESKEKLSELLKTLQIELHSLNKDLENKNENLKDRIENKSKIDNKIKALKEEIYLLDERNKNILENIKNLQEEKVLIDNKRIENKENITNLINEKNNIEKGSIELRKSLKLKSESKEKVVREKIRLDEKKRSINEKYDQIISRLFDDYELTYTDAVSIAFTLSNVMASKSKLQDLKNKIKILGNINVSAIDEYKVVKERYDFLETQIADINKSKTEIKKLISDITENMKVQFKDVFNKININFKRIFEELFGGGYGELILLDEDDVLNSGIEINISPPGKKVKNISLLSGGEKSFVAIAIYFAIFHVKPASFCILDEIEAALDDVNVIRFARYIKNLSKDTQFIAVTHRRGTMEEADVLYGITMQKEGISKCVKLDSSNKENVL